MATESAADETREVTVGGRSYKIARFRGFKAQQVLRLAAAIGKKYPKLAEHAAGFERAYVDDNQLLLTRAEAELRFGEEAREISDEAWKESGGVVGRKRMPDRWERIANLWPEILEAAERPALDLVAVISMSNQEIADADEADNMQQAIADRRREILGDGDATEIVDLVVAGVEVARGQFAPLVDRMTPLLGMLGMTMVVPEPTTSSTSSTTEPEASSPSSSDSLTSPSSSTDSPPLTDGPESKPSAPPGSPSDDSQSD